VAASETVGGVLGPEAVEGCRDRGQRGVRVVVDDRVRDTEADHILSGQPE